MNLSSALLAVAQEASLEVAEVLSRGGLPYSSEYTPARLRVSAKEVRKMPAAAAEQLVRLLDEVSLRQVWAVDKRKGVRYALLASPHLPEDLACQGVAWLAEQDRYFDGPLLTRLYNHCTLDDLVALGGNSFGNFRADSLAQVMSTKITDRAALDAVLAAELHSSLRNALGVQMLLGALPISPNDALASFGSDEHVMRGVQRGLKAPLSVEMADLHLQHDHLRDSRMSGRPLRWSDEAEAFLADAINGPHNRAAIDLLMHADCKMTVAERIGEAQASQLSVEYVIELVNMRAVREDFQSLRQVMLDGMVESYDTADINHIRFLMNQWEILRPESAVKALNHAIAKGHNVDRISATAIEKMSHMAPEDRDGGLVEALLASPAPVQARVTILSESTDASLRDSTIEEYVGQLATSTSYHDSRVARNLLEKVTINPAVIIDVVIAASNESQWAKGVFVHNPPFFKGICDLIDRSSRPGSLLNELATIEDKALLVQITEAAVERCVANGPIQESSTEAAIADACIAQLPLSDELIVKLLKAYGAEGARLLVLGSPSNPPSVATRRLVYANTEPGSVASPALAKSFVDAHPEPDELGMLKAEELAQLSRSISGPLLNQVALPDGFLVEWLCLRPNLTLEWAQDEFQANPCSDELLWAVLEASSADSPLPVSLAEQLIETPRGRAFLRNHDGFVTAVRASSKAGQVTPATRALWQLLHEDFGDDVLKWTAALGLLESWPSSLFILVTTAKATVS